MRNDLDGLFWNDVPAAKKAKKEIIKREPPERTWEAPDYLPYLDEARAFPVTHFTIDRLWEAAARGVALLVDVEIYPNYFLAAFTSTETGEVTYVEADDEQPLIDVNKLGWLMQNFPTVGFNSNTFDMTIIVMALGGYSIAQMKEAANAMIQEGVNHRDVLKACKLVVPREFNHVDLFDVCPLSASLKIYGGRLHAPRMQELPFKPDTWLSRNQKTVVRWYCIGADLVSTGFVWANLEEQRKLRDEMTVKYGVDVRSKSDAQIAEAVIMQSLRRISNRKYPRPEVVPGTIYRYQSPPFLKFQTPLMNEVLRLVCEGDFVVGENGYVSLPPAVAGLTIPIGRSVYRMGIGGLHSTEERQEVKADARFKLKDVDVVSYYPRIIINCRLYPQHLGIDFLFVYAGIVDDRVKAKAAKLKAIAESLKIVANGTFGKLLQPGGPLYAPDLGMQVTITGQLLLLMLIEMLELAAFEVISGNTDGVVIKVDRSREAECDAIVKAWEKATGFETEETEYLSINSRDVNNYIAVKPDGKTKNKGYFANPWADMKDDAKAAVMRFHKNPVNTICIEACVAYIAKGIPAIETIKASRDITKFVTVRNVTGGGVKINLEGYNEYLGKAVRWYYSTQAPGEIVYARSGNKVPKSEGAKPCLNLPKEFPDDIDYQWYEKETLRMLYSLGAVEMDASELEACGLDE